MLLLGSKIKVPSSSNVEFEGEDLYFLSSELLNSFLPSNDLELESGLKFSFDNEYPVSKEIFTDSYFSEMTLVHSAGYVGYVLKHKHNKCYGQISRSAPHITNSERTFELSKGGLFIPNESLVNNVNCRENFFSRLSKSELINRSNITETLCSRIFC